CQVYTPYTFALNPEYHTYAKRGNARLFVERIYSGYEDSGPAYWHLNPPPALHGLERENQRGGGNY
ncbi:MAG: hypothetical protein Q8R92_06515, partial [Deltaproteobacteria bacterium]|nr:hypothetical protein [Deltaproteobacteria bacterium]